MSEGCEDMELRTNVDDYELINAVRDNDREMIGFLAAQGILNYPEEFKEALVVAMHWNRRQMVDFLLALPIAKDIRWAFVVKEEPC
jgi:hypothetical protein